MLKLFSECKLQKSIDFIEAVMSISVVAGDYVFHQVDTYGEAYASEAV